MGLENDPLFTGDSGGGSGNFWPTLLRTYGGIMSAQGQMSAAAGSAEAYNYNAQVDENNAKQAILISAEQERQQRIYGRKQIGQMRTAYGASGVTVEGSPTDVLAESMAAAELDALNTRFAGQSKAVNFRNSATLNRINARNVRSAGETNAAATLLQTAVPIALALA